MCSTQIKILGFDKTEGDNTERCRTVCISLIALLESDFFISYSFGFTNN